MQGPDLVLQQAASETCDLDGAAWKAMLRPGGVKIVAMAEDSAPAHPAPTAAMPPSDSSDLAVTEVAGQPSPGEHARVERPPRA